MRTKRDPETADERESRLTEKTGKKRDDDASAEQAVDAMIRRSIEQHGA